MQIIEPSYEILAIVPADPLQHIELAGRTCYKSEDKITADSAEGFVRRILKSDKMQRLSDYVAQVVGSGMSAADQHHNIMEQIQVMLDDPPHESVIEHATMSVRFVCDRGVSHELVRHRLCGFSQESTRYCNYGKGRFGSHITVIRPVFWEGEDEREAYEIWERECLNAEDAYLDLVARGARPEQARSVLPNSLKTEIVVTANLREWRHIFRLRTSLKAHPQMRQLMRPLLAECRRRVPVLFDDVGRVAEAQ
jgi:thymidylate synthase (FAD)